MFLSRVTSMALLLATAVLGVEPGQPSGTSRLTAAARAIGAKNPDPEFRNPDYLAIQFLGPRERALMTGGGGFREALDLDFEAAVKRLQGGGALVTTMFFRTKHIDSMVDQSLRDRVQQIVILGAGLDSRGYRFQDRLRGVRFFEVDQPPTQENKKQRVKEVLGALPKHVRYVPMDFTKDDLLTELRKEGYSEKSKTLFVWEGVTMYLPQSAVESTLQFVRDHSGPGSGIVFDYYLSTHPFINNPDSNVAKKGEPMLFGFPVDGAAGFVRQHGLEVVSDLTSTQLQKRYAERTDGTSSLPTRPTDARGFNMCYARVPVEK
jgi:methyltransferase (TIGR00027 family)